MSYHGVSDSWWKLVFGVAPDYDGCSKQAARSIGCLTVAWSSVCQPSTRRMVICPEAISAQNGAVTLIGFRVEWR